MRTSIVILIGFLCLVLVFAVGSTTRATGGVWADMEDLNLGNLAGQAGGTSSGAASWTSNYRGGAFVVDLGGNQAIALRDFPSFFTRGYDVPGMTNDSRDLMLGDIGFLRVFMMTTSGSSPIGAEVWFAGDSGTSESHENGRPGGAAGPPDGTIWVYDGTTPNGSIGSGTWTDTGGTWKGGAVDASSSFQTLQFANYVPGDGGSTNSSYELIWGGNSLGTYNTLTSDPVQNNQNYHTASVPELGNNVAWVDNIHVVSEPAVLPPGTDFTWNSSESGDWVDASNWDGPSGYPGLTIDTGTPPPSIPARQSALFGNAISTSQTVFTNMDVSVNAINFENSSASYAIAGHGSVNLLANTRPVNPNPAINVAAGNSHQFQATVNFHANGTVDIGSGSTLEFNNRLFLNSNALTKTGEGTLAINNNVVTGGGTVNCAQGICSGTGTIGGDLNNDGGTISPGNSSLRTQTQVPEPAGLVLLAMGAAILGATLRRCRRKAA